MIDRTILRLSRLWNGSLWRVHDLKTRHPSLYRETLRYM
jgi:hypothetical protein